MRAYHYRHDTALPPRVILTTSKFVEKMSRQKPRAVVISVMSQTIARNGTVIRLGPTRFNAAYCMLAAQGRPVTTAEIADFIWGDRVDGGPDYADMHFQSVISCRLREHLAPLGIGFESAFSMGCRAVDLRDAGSLEMEAA